MLAATSAGSCRPCWSASGSAMPSELHGCRCAARRLARRFSQPQTRPYERTNHLPPCVLQSCGYVSVSLNRTRLVRATGVGPSQRARVQHADTLQHAPQGSRCSEALLVQPALQGVDAVESSVLHRTLSCSPQGPYRVLYRVVERSQVGDTNKYPGVYTKRTHDGRARNRAPEHSSFELD